MHYPTADIFVLKDLESRNLFLYVARDFATIQLMNTNKKQTRNYYSWSTRKDFLPVRLQRHLEIVSTTHFKTSSMQYCR